MIKNRLVAAGAAAALATGTALMAVPAHAATPKSVRDVASFMWFSSGTLA
ncbi:hypothetical protein NNA67_09990 [Cutibacterium acnes]|nr:hypothetical protein [Cutibacterium acnes]